MPVRVTVYLADVQEGRKAVRAAFDRVAHLDAMLSDYRADSEVSRLAARSGDWVPVSRELFDVMARASGIAAATGGAFDPTIGPLVALWREARRTGRLPDRARLAAARALVGWRRVALDPERRAIRLTRQGIRIDLGGIGKGYILQEALAALRAHGMSRALVEAGGDLVAGDAPPDRAGWRIDVPGAAPAFTRRAAALANAALATSGPTAQFVEIGGRRYSHVVDPRTGIGMTDGRVAHVIASDGATADALATALTVLKPEEGRALLARFPGVVAAVTVP